MGKKFIDMTSFTVYVIGHIQTSSVEFHTSILPESKFRKDTVPVKYWVS